MPSQIESEDYQCFYWPLSNDALFCLLPDVTLTKRSVAADSSSVIQPTTLPNGEEMLIAVNILLMADN